jgi:hypothetical protein
VKPSPTTRGCLPEDAASTACDAPTYAAVLGAVHNAARDLEAIGKIELSQRPADRIIHTRDKYGAVVERLVAVTEYVATGR